MTRDIRLVDLELRGFKGVEAFRLDLDGSSAIVRGDNATGKTTLADAYTWLLFGKDAHHRSAFEIKTLRADGLTVLGHDHEVRATFAIDGEPVTLRRVYREKWTKKRGAAKEELTGHTTDYEVDGVPVQKKEWTERVDDLFGPEDRLRLLTDPLYFASVVAWDQRRAILLELVGDVTEAEAEALEPDLVELRKARGKRSPEEFAKVLAATRRELNGELARLPDRVDEAARGLAGAPDETPDELAAQVDAARARVAELDAASTPAGEIVRIGAELAAARQRLERAKAETAREAERARAGHEREVAHAQAHVDHARDRAKRAAADVERLDAQLAEDAAALERLRAAYAAARLEPVDAQVADVCPCCSRPLEADAIEEARRKATAEANARKAARIRAIAADGQSARDRFEELERRRAEAEAERVDALEEAEALAEILAELRGSFKAPEAGELAIAGTLVEIEDLEAALSRAQEAQEPRERDASTQEARAQLDELLERLARSREAERARARVAELEARERELAEELERVDRQLYLLDVRARTRARILTERVDDRFESVRFRLFTEQLNGALAEACDVTVDGVPWGDLNHGARMNAGLEIIRELGAFYGLRAPVWLDNAESVTSWRDVGVQTIRLEVDGNAAELTVERV
jgi:DNA repair exonuclease SbcCD ATPase subunit